MSLTSSLLLICVYFHHYYLDETIRSDGSEEKFSIFCGTFTSTAATDFRYQPNVVTKLILRGKCVAESIGTYLNYTVKNDDFAYGMYFCYQRGISSQGMILLKTVKIVPTSGVFTSDTIRGRIPLLAGKTFNYICQASSQLLDPDGVIKLMYPQKNKIYAKSKILNSPKANRKMRLQIGNSGEYLCSVTSNNIQLQHEVYPKQMCTYVAKSLLEVYQSVKLEMASMYSYKDDGNYAIIGARMNADWTFESMDLHLPSIKIDNVYVENGVLYIYKLNHNNYGTYLVVNDGKTVEITINNGEDRSVSMVQQSDSIDYYDESNEQEDLPSDPIQPSRPTRNGCKFMNPSSVPVSESFVGDSPGDTNSNCVSGDCTKVYTLDPSSSFTYTCEGIGDSVQNMYFIKDGTKISPSRILRLSSAKWSAMLEITSVKMNDSGNYECVMEFMTKNSRQIIEKRIPFKIDVKSGS